MAMVRSRFAESRLRKQSALHVGGGGLRAAAFYQYKQQAGLQQYITRTKDTEQDINRPQ
jgi:hypothetical protein